MRTKSRRPSTRTLTALVAGGLLAASVGTAHADLIVNSVDDSIDMGVEQMDLVLGAAGETTIYVEPKDDDKDPGCNFDGFSESVTVNLVSDRPEVATVSPATLVLSACGTAGAQPVTVTPAGVGTATITTTVAPGTNSTGGTFSIANARFSAKVAERANTAPRLDVVGVEDGQKFAKGTFERPECVATDPDDVPTPPHTKTWLAPLTALTGPHAVDGLGTRAAMCSYVDEYGVQVLARKTFSIVDTSPPVIQRSLDPELPANGWYTGDVTLTHKVFENQSPSSFSPPTDCDVTVTEDTRLTTVSCSATSAGGTNTVATNIRRDATAPVVSPTATVSGTLGENGWYRSPVEVAFTATDATSLFLVDNRATGTSSTTVEVGDGEHVVQSPAFTDRAGNASAVGAATLPVKVDMTAPALPDASVTPADAEGAWTSEDVVVSFTSDDTGSGVDSCTPDVTVDAETAWEGEVVTGTCTDKAGNVSAEKQVTVRIDRTGPTVSEATAAAPTGDNGWYTSDVDVTFSATDALSGVETDSQTAPSRGEGEAVEVSSPAFTDRAGNATDAGAVTKTYAIDKTAPAVPTFRGGLSGYLYAWGDTPAAPTCTSSDVTSGLASCVVTGSGSTVGLHTYTATATDVAGNTSTATRRYVVAPWRLKGFSSPIDMRKPNTVKGGSTVPAKFEVFAGLKEITDPAKVTLRSTSTDCSTGRPLGAAQAVSSTALRYDTRAGQFVSTWKAPTGKGTCHALTLATPDGSSVTATFTVK